MPCSYCAIADILNLHLEPMLLDLNIEIQEEGINPSTHGLLGWGRGVCECEGGSGVCE